MLKRYILIIAASLYLFIWFGFVFHTNAYPEIFNKYNLKYFGFLILSLAGFIPFNEFINYLFVKSSYAIKGHKINLDERKKILIALIFFFVIFLSFECFVRISGINKTTRFVRAGQIENYHPFLQMQLAKQDNKDNPFLNINSLGFRGEEITREKSQNTFRVFILGGSTVLNGPIHYEETFPRVLEKLLQKKYPDKKIEVQNAGMDGYTTEHEVILYLFKIRDYNPDLFISFQGVNDMWFSCTNSRFKNDYSARIGKMPTTYFNDINNLFSFHINFKTIDFLTSRLESVFYSDVNPKFNYSLAKKMIGLKLVPNVIDSDFSKGIFPYERNLEILINSVISNNTSVIIGNQPYLYDMSRDLNYPYQWYMQMNCLSDNKVPNTKSLIKGIDLYNKSTEKITRDMGVNFVNLNSQMPKNWNYFRDDVHFTEVGNEKVAEMFFKEIINKNLID